MGYSLRGLTESDMTEQLHFHFLQGMEKGKRCPHTRHTNNAESMPGRDTLGGSEVSAG